METSPTRNRLAEETSPYLLQHKDNPVHWQAWSAETLALAERTGKPILLSIGYAACHWCHVMAHESFEDPEVAAVMNALFVNVKLDREERPDIDALYQQSLALLGQQGGWPLTMFLTPRGEPFWGGTYFPKTPRFGRPGLPEILRQVAAVFREQPDRVAESTARLGEALARLARPEPGAGIGLDLTDAVARRLAREVDPFFGGFGRAPKFPQPSLLLLLWRAAQRTGLEPFRRAVRTTLDHMCEGGIYDHLGGGFARYSTDEQWLVPHFEKMLYDNAQLIELLSVVWRDTGSELYRQRVAETVGWVLREMVAQSGAFAASYDADSEGEEGRFYVWTAAEVDAALVDLPPGDADLFKAHYDVAPGGNWEGRIVLNRRRRHGPFDSATEAALARCRGWLLDLRRCRVWPAWDDKALADWNGLMIGALAEAGGAFGRADWLEAARRALDAVVATQESDGRLRHSWRDGRAAHPATIEDYATMARGALRLHETTGDAALLARARAWVAVADRHHWDGDAGGYFTSADDTADILRRGKTAADDAVPAGNGLMVEVLARLWLLTGEAGYRDRAEHLVRTFAGEVAGSLSPLASLLNGNELLIRGRQVVIVGSGAAADLLRRRALSAGGRPRVVQTVADGNALPTGHPAHGKGPAGGAAVAYVCDGATCSLPIDDPEALAARLAA